MDLLALLNELQALARTGLHFAQNTYDRDRYRRLLELASQGYGELLDLPPALIREHWAAEIGPITPKVGANAAIFDRAGRVLLIQRSDDHTWCQPCGWVEVHESPADAAIREAREETGLEVRIIQLVDVLYRPASATNGPHALAAVIYLCETIGGTLRNSHESLDLRYWAIDEVPRWHPGHENHARTAHAAWLALQHQP